ncbi:MAG: alpha-amylase family glycosyl hydrolase [Chloroflexota bacterium]
MDALIEQAHALGNKVTLDLVPNYTSDQHAWFRAAVAAGRGSPERACYHFRDGRGLNGDQPPSNWRAVFGGSSWTRVTEPDGTPGQWYYPPVRCRAAGSSTGPTPRSSPSSSRSSGSGSTAASTASGSMSPTDSPRIPRSPTRRTGQQ